MDAAPARARPCYASPGGPDPNRPPQPTNLTPSTPGQRRPPDQLCLDSYPPIQHRRSDHKLGWIQPQWRPPSAPTHVLLPPPPWRSHHNHRTQHRLNNNPHHTPPKPHDSATPPQQTHQPHSGSCLATLPPDTPPTPHHTRFPRPYDWDPASQAGIAATTTRHDPPGAPLPQHSCTTRQPDAGLTAPRHDSRTVHATASSPPYHTQQPPSGTTPNSAPSHKTTGWGYLYQQRDFPAGAAPPTPASTANPDNKEANFHRDRAMFRELLQHPPRLLAEHPPPDDTTIPPAQDTEVDCRTHPTPPTQTQADGPPRPAPAHPPFSRLRGHLTMPSITPATPSMLPTKTHGPPNSALPFRVCHR